MHSFSGVLYAPSLNEETHADILSSSSSGVVFVLYASMDAKSPISSFIPQSFLSQLLPSSYSLLDIFRYLTDYYRVLGLRLDRFPWSVYFKPNFLIIKKINEA
jgi:hypothetical protein